jgi:uncharacterized membrane protein YphA (DoxX/SURF4 family)
MSADQLPAKRSTLDIVSVVARWALGACFLYMGYVKAMDPKAFLEVIHEYNAIHNYTALNSIALLLPWFEMFCGLLLIFGIAVRGSALALIAMLIPFTGLILRRAIAVAVTEHKAFCAIRFDCGCGAGEVLICSKLLENGGLIFLAFWLLFARSRRFCLRYGLFRPPEPDSVPPLTADSPTH